MKIFFTKVFRKISVTASDILANWTATWTFIFIYSAFMIGWALVNKFHISTFDENYTGLQLTLNWLAGIQASIILMAGNRQQERDRQNLLKSLELEKKQDAGLSRAISKLNQIMNKIEKLEEIIQLIEQEEVEPEQEDKE